MPPLRNPQTVTPVQRRSRKAQVLTLVVCAALGGCTEAPKPEPTQLELPTPKLGSSEGDAAPDEAASKRACIDAAGNLGEARDKIVRAFCSEFVTSRAPGAVLVLRARDQPPLTLARGIRCNEHDDPVVPNTPFRIGSITKPFTALLVLSLAEGGKLALDDEVARHLPELADSPWGSITVGSLLNHTSGLPLAPITINVPDRDPNGRSWIELVGELPRDTEAAPTWRYSNIGYALLGEIVARVGGEPWHDAVEHRLLEPLGLAGMTAHESRVASEAACGHLAGSSPPLRVTGDAPLMGGHAMWPRATASLLGTATDLADFADRQVSALQSDPDAPLTPAFQRMLDGEVESEHGEHQTYGWRRIPGEGTAVYRHGGNTGHFASELYFAADGSFTLAYVVNTDTRFRATVMAVLSEYSRARLTE